MRVLKTDLVDKRFFIVFRLLLLSGIFFLLSNNIIQAQVGTLEFAGRAIKDGVALPGAIITVYRGGTIQQEQVKVGKNGKFKFFLAFGIDYKITFSYPGCVDMYLMVFTSKLPKNRDDLAPLYQTEIPFFETTNTSVRITKYKNPFTKVIYDGKKAFMDDEAYLAAFTKDLLIDPAEQARLFAEKEAKEKAEKDKLLAVEKARKDAEEKVRKDAEEKLLAEQRAKEDAFAKEAELARLKAESENAKLHTNETMETEAMRLQREKEAKALLAKKNKEIKTKYVNDLLKLVADNERMAKQHDFNKQKSNARSNTVIEQMKKESDLKAKADGLREEQKLKKKKELENKQYKLNEIRKLLEAAAFAERSVRIGKQKSLPDVNGYTRKELPNVGVTIDDGIIKTIRITTVTLGKNLETYRKETYFWGTATCYKNNIEISETTYNTEIDYYSSYLNK